MSWLFMLIYVMGLCQLLSMSPLPTHDLSHHNAILTEAADYEGLFCVDIWVKEMRSRTAQWTG